ncbi:MAG: DUF4303 domain-containing protein [Rubritalea sp.]|uniref:DUF4303 domain-containing protein n=1 Tax=Rubritalea sp. TaxID=2109375 RepID=UPI0032427C1C
MSKSNWKLYYDYSSSEPQFAEVTLKDGKTFIRKGRVFTGGTIEEVDSLEGQLEGYELAREWNFDSEVVNYGLFEAELDAACQREVGDSNAIAIITDGSVMTIGLAVNKFDDFTAVEDDELWIVDEWGEWIEDGGLDPAYRWLKAHEDIYDYDSDDYYEKWDVYRDSVLDAMERCLSRLPNSVAVKLIYAGDNDFGYERSLKHLGEVLRPRLDAWFNF